VASDLYSLGSTLYQLLAGRPAFQGAPDEGLAQLMMRILREPPPVIPRGDLPRPVFDAIAQAMAKSPHHRFGGAVDFARRLQGLQAELGLPVTDLLYAGGAAGARAATGSVTLPPRSAAPLPAGATRDPWAPAAPGPEAFVSFPVTGEHIMGRTAPPAPAWPTRPSEGEAASGPRPDVSGGHADGPRRGLLVAGAVALAGGLAIGLTGVVVFTSGSGRTPGPGPGPASAPSRPAVRTDAGQTTGDEQTGVRPLTAHQIKAAAPRAVKVVAVGASARLSWTLPPSARRLPIIVQRSPAGRTAVSSAGTGAVTTTAGGLKPHGRYCFRVGALLSPGNPPTIAWSAIRCVRTG
jgi:hypothetical protein